MPRMTSGRVRQRRSLLPWRSFGWSLNCSPRKSASLSFARWIIVPIAPSRTRIRSSRSCAQAVFRRGRHFALHLAQTPKNAGSRRPQKHTTRLRGSRWSTSSVSRVLFRARGRPRRGGGHSSRAAVTGRLEQPTRGLGRVTLHGRLLRDDAARPPMWPCSRWGLPCRLRYRRRGGLLPRRFTLACRSACCHVEAGGLFSVALSFAFPRPGVTRHRALWSSDFPPVALLRRLRRTAGSRPAIACTASTRAKQVATCAWRPQVRSRCVSAAGRTNASAVTNGTTTSP